MEREIKQLSEALDKDYGEESVFAVLHGSCFDYTDNEYTYKLCPFDYCSQVLCASVDSWCQLQDLQRGKHGGAETRLGGWGKWEGPAARPHSVMKFTGGQVLQSTPYCVTALVCRAAGTARLARAQYISIVVQKIL